MKMIAYKLMIQPLVDRAKDDAKHPKD